MAGGVRRGRGPGRQAQLGEQVGHVTLDGVVAEAQPRSDVGITQALRHEAQDFELAARQRRLGLRPLRADPLHTQGTKRLRRPARLALSGAALARRGECLGEREPGARGLILLYCAQRAYEPRLSARGVVVTRLVVPQGFRRPDGTIDTAPVLLVRGVVTRTG